MITDSFLNEMAKAMGDESYLSPAYLAVGTSDVDAVLASDTALSEEVGSRISLTKSGSVNFREFSAIRSGANVIDTVNGDPIESTGIFNTATEATSDPLLSGVAISGVTQTTNFDIEVVFNLTIDRQ